ncbi:MAG: RagB/SusD family nutrient uptake outer membrane protein [Roseivirga sp.]
MKRLKKAALLLSALFLLYGCEDFLDLSPISEETSDVAYNSASQIEAALTGVYESFQAEYYVWDNVLFQDVRADNHYAGGDNPEIFQIDLLNISSTNSRLFRNWSNIYNAIAKANVVIENAPLVDDPQLTETRRSQILGEAHFLRAFHYYTLVNLWGGVPLVTQFTASANPEDTQLPRSTEEEVFALILSDLELAIASLPDTYGGNAAINKARATAGAANALAAKASLQKPVADYMAALQYIEALEASAAGYRLISYPALFDGNNYNNAESILEVQYLGANEGNFGPQLVLPPSISGDTWRKFVTPSQDLLNAYNAEGDVIRRDASVLFETVNWVDEYWGNRPGSSIPFAYKWKNADSWASSNRPYLLRYGDIVLLKAEALAGLNRLSEAAIEVNRIRNRVSLADLPVTASSSQENMRRAILKERRLELAQEAQRWDDLVRFESLVTTMNALNEIDLRTGSPTQYDMNSSKILLPIPQEELDRNPNLNQN